MKSIGIMGGTFNPIHKGHLAIAQAAYEQYKLDEIWFMPNHIPGYKNHDDILDANIRFQMVQLAIADYSYFKASDFELKRSGNTYTADTMKRLCEIYPEVQFYFIIGADSLDYFDKWKAPEEIVSHAEILAAPRNQESIADMLKTIEKLECQYGSHFHIINCNVIPCSSSEIRAALKKHVNNEESNILRFLPDIVLHYIYDNHLFENK